MLAFAAVCGPINRVLFHARRSREGKTGRENIRISSAYIVSYVAPATHTLGHTHTHANTF